MSKPRLLLVHCSTIFQPRKDKSEIKHFRPLLIRGSDRETPDLKASSWELAFQLAELGMLVSSRNYLALFQASMVFITSANSDWQRMVDKST
jgi:hypothetical protein